MSKTIVIDDNPMDHLIMRKLFDHYGIFPERIHSLDGAEIISFFQENRHSAEILPDTILLDLNMPYSGWTFMEQLEKLFSSLAKKPVVYIVTSSTDLRDKALAAAYSFVKGYMLKPLNKEMLSVFSQL